jgi:hypothetical protein
MTWINIWIFHLIFNLKIKFYIFLEKEKKIKNRKLKRNQLKVLKLRKGYFKKDDWSRPRLKENVTIESSSSPKPEERFKS